MIAAAAVIWATLQAEAPTPRANVGHQWTFAAVADASLQPLFTYPGYENGVHLVGGFRFAHPLGPCLRFVWSGRAGATYVDDWRTVFESSAMVVWPRAGVELDGGVRHDNRLSREGPRAGFRDPTGRAFISAAAMPLHRGWFAAGASFEYQRGMPGDLRLPSSASGSVVVRVQPADRK